MATYKVIQDIEAEDKLVGPLTLRQFIYAAIGAVAGYICFLGITKGAYFILAVFLPVVFIAGFFAFPWKGDQPTEIWALARLRFAVKPRRRIWDQTGVKDYVTITVPKKVRVNYTNGLNPEQVTSRLHTLADVIDSRGWATKNAVYNAYAQPTAFDPNSDRLVGANTGPQEVPAGDVITNSDDMLDEGSRVAQNLSSMLSKFTSDRRRRVMKEMTDAQTQKTAPAPQPSNQGPSLPSPVMPAQPNPQPLDTTWFTNPTAAVPSSPPAQVIAPGTAEGNVPTAAAAEPTAAEEALAHQLKEQNQAAQQISYGHLHVVQPLSGGSTQPQKTSASLIDYSQSTPAAGSTDDAAAKQKAMAEEARKRAEAAVTHQRDDAIIKELSVNNDEDIATLARRASKEIRKSPDEVEIRLH